ncbi:MAG: Type 1 glutamine amidotransferase-like domain-containing protein [Oscillospiraceae bacterium]|nr:Type 1 glutamine amidotransferase-like domain-containing protein [Oscillospiraceae bacterium]
MKAMLTSSLGGSSKVNGIRVPSVLIQHNGLLDELRSIWIPNAKVLIICADPSDYEQNDSICACLKEALPMSGLSISHIDMCDDRDLHTAEDLESVDVLLLAGGHVPTQNRFMEQLRLRERLRGYDGVIIAWSAGSMNCADIVYAAPELEGETIDPLYERWITGLGMTEINILPHFQSLKDECLDGLRLIEDVIFPDSVGHEMIALNDGSYIMIVDGKKTLFGEAYMIKDGHQWQICEDGGSLSL